MSWGLPMSLSSLRSLLISQAVSPSVPLQLTHLSFHPCLFLVGSTGAEAAMCGLPAEQFPATSVLTRSRNANPAVGTSCLFSLSCPPRCCVPAAHLSGSKTIRRFEVSHAPADTDRTTHLLLQPQSTTLCNDVGNPELGNSSLTFV